LGDRIRFDRLDPRPLRQDTLDDRLLGCVMQPADVEDGRGGVAVLGVAGVRGHNYRVFVNRCTAAKSSLLFVVATRSSPAVSAS